VVWYVDHRHDQPCCLLEQDEAQIEAEPELYQCDTCPVAAFPDRLSPENRFAWGIYHQTCTRLAGEGHALGEVLRRFTAPLTDEEFEDCWVRLNILHDLLSPPATPDGR
jgi:hypothetical protein